MTSSPTSSPAHKATLLVVDDNADQWALIRWALNQQFPEVDPVWVQGAEQTAHYLQACLQGGHSLPTLILLDLYLPERYQGWNLLETIKTHHLYREIPVVVFSQSNDPEDISESYSLRGNSYIVKPIGYDKWLDCIASFRYYWWNAVSLPKLS